MDMKIRRKGFAIYCHTLSVEAVARTLGVSKSEIDEIRKLEDWDSTAREMAREYVDPIRKNAAGWLYERFRNLDKAFSSALTDLEGSESGKEMLAYMQSLAEAHDRQMLMIGKPTNISETRTGRGYGEYSDEELDSALGVVEESLAELEGGSGG